MSFKTVFKKSICFIVVCMVLWGIISFPVLASKKLPNPLAGGSTTPIGLATIIGRVVQALLGVIGIVSLLYFIIGGFYYLGSAGNPEKIKKGTQTITWAVIGMILAFGSYAIVNFIFTSVGIVK